MAYMNQEIKKKKELAIKPILKRYGITGRCAVDNHFTIVLNISKGKIDFMNSNKFLTKEVNYIQVNPNLYKESFTGEALNFLNEVMEILNEGNFDKSDIQSYYFHVGFYVEINIGKWNKPYTYQP